MRAVGAHAAKRRRDRLHAVAHRAFTRTFLPPGTQVASFVDSAVHDRGFMGQGSPEHSTRHIRLVGGFLAFVFGMSLLFIVETDHQRRVEGAQAQNQAFADEGQRILGAQLLNLERAMNGIAADSASPDGTVPSDVAAELVRHIAGVAERRSELADLLLVDASGAPLTPGEGDPSLPRWFDATNPGHLRLGKLERRHGRWMLPLAVAAPGGNRVFARLRQEDLQDVVEHLPAGADAIAAITDRYGIVLARTGDVPDAIGQPAELLLRHAGAPGERVSGRIGGVERMIAVGQPEHYPLWVGVGVTTASVLGPWYRFTVLSALLYLLYCLGFGYMFRRLRVSDRAQQAYVSDLTSATTRLADAEQRFRLIFDKSPIPFWVYDTTTLAFLEVNEAAVRSYGYARDEFLAMRITDIRDAHDADELIRVVASVRAGDEGQPDRVWIHRRKDGSTLDVRLHAVSLDFAGHAARLVLAEDITDSLRTERALTYRATHDVITGLPNTEALVDYLDQGMGRDAWYEVVYVHLRGIDHVTDTFGLDAGRGVLRAVASRFGRLAGVRGMVAHRPGERFLVAITDPASHDATMSALLDAVTEPVAVNDALHTLDPQIGLARHPADGADAGQVIANAALAAHFKHVDDDPGKVQVYDRLMAQRSMERLTMASRMRQAIERGELTVHYQPIVDARDGQIRSLEALVRWPQADGGSIAPDVFIPLCEETGLIVPLGHWAFGTAARAHAALTAAGHGHLSIAVNVSAVQFRRTDVAAEVRSASLAHGLPSHALQVELTESSLMEPGYALAALTRLNEQGTRVSLDDFGTGFSSLSYLRDLPIDALKIDRSFIVGLGVDERAASICRSIIALARTLDMAVVAEGVERERQRSWLRDNGCDRIQGYFVKAAMPLNDLLAYLVAGQPNHLLT